MALNYIPHPKLETKLTILTGVLFFLPLLFASIYINSIVRHEHNAMYAQRADKTARALAASPLAARIGDALHQGKNADNDLEILYESARSQASSTRYVALTGGRDIWLFYPPQDDHIKNQARLRALQEWAPSSMSEKVATGIFQTVPLPVTGITGSPEISLVVGYAAGEMDALISHITLPLQEMMLAFMLLGVLLAAFLAKSIRKILLGLEPEEIATLLQERNAMLGIMTEGVIAIDADMRVTLVNEEATRILAMAGTDGAVGSQSLAKSPLVLELQRVAESGQASQNVEQNLRGVTVLANYKPVSVEGRIAGAIVTFKDMSELRQLAESITDINRYVDALRSQSHEFLNKLHVIMGLVDKERLEDLRAYIEELVSSSTEEGRIIHNSVKDPLIAGFLASKYSHAREMGVTLHFSMHGILPPLDDAALRNGLVTILGNLIDNALDAVERAEDKKVTVSVSVEDDELLVAVKDCGPGIAAPHKTEVFSKGYSSKGEGRGLGLWLVKKTLSSLQGTIQIESDHGLGAVFLVRLPLPTGSGDA